MSKICIYGRCDRPARTRGLCGGHYEQQRLGRELSPLIEKFPKGTWTNTTTCTIDGCKNPHRAKGMCSGHLWQVQKSKKREVKKLRVFSSGDWGKLCTDSNGYKFRARRNPNTKRTEKQFQHRQVMEEMLGRPLMRHENVHHLNGDRGDNSPRNLELWSRSQPSGQRALDKLNWARELMELYGPIESELNEQRDRSKSFHEPLDIAEEGASPGCYRTT